MNPTTLFRAFLRPVSSTAVLLLVAACGLYGATRVESPRLPPHFEPNRGQAPTSASFISYGEGFRLLIEPSRTTVQLKTPGTEAATIACRLVDASETVRLEGLARLPGLSSYFMGNDPENWIRGVPHYSSLRSAGVYDGIDLIYRGSTRQALEYDFIVRPGADPNQIVLEFTGAEVSIADNGDLVLRAPGGELRQKRPELFQEIGGTRRAVRGSFVSLTRNRVGFRVGPYNRDEALVIDPVLDYSTYLGGSDPDSVRAIAVDAEGNTYIAGRTDSFDFPETNRHGGLGRGDVFVTKLNTAGDAILYSAIIGGAGDDAANAIAVNAAGEVFLTGFTRSLEFPITPGAFQRIYFGGNSDVFITRLSADGASLVYSTYVGGWATDYANGIAIDGANNAYITGATSSYNYPTTIGAFQPIRVGLDLDIILTKMNSEGTRLVYSTFLISEYDDEGFSVAVDADGRAYVGGFTGGLLFPVTSNAFQRDCHYDGFVTKFNPEGSHVDYSSCLGGGSLDEVRGLAIDATGTAYVTGFTQSENFPVTQRNPLIRCGRSDDAFGARFTADGSGLIFSGCLGGDHSDIGRAVALDTDGNAYFIGETASSNFPVTPDAISGVRSGDLDVFVAKVDANGTVLLSSTYLGGEREDSGLAIAVDSNGVAHIGGSTDSGDFPTTEGAIQDNKAGAFDGFVAWMHFEVPPPTINPDGVVNGAGFQPGPVSPGSIVAVFGQGFSTTTSDSTEVPLPTTLAGVKVTINGIEAPLFFVSPTQINFQLPVEVEPGEATIVVNLGDTPSEPQTFTVVPAAPGIFNDRTRAIVSNQDGTLNTPATPAMRGSVVVVWLSGIGPTLPPQNTNMAAPVAPLSRATSDFSATVGDMDAPVHFLGLAPGFIGLAQANITVPEVADGEHPVVITVNGVESNGPTLSVNGP